MNKEAEYDGSDSSDEDFCPEKEAAAGDSEVASEEEQLDEDSADEEQEHDGDDEDINAKSTKAAKGSRKKLKKRQRKSRKTAEDSEDEQDEKEQEISRRSTRQTGKSSKRDGKNATHEKDELESEEDEKIKSHRDALWADFLSDAKPLPTRATKAVPKEASKANSASSSRTKTTPNGTNGSKCEKNDEAKNEQVITGIVAEEREKITVTEICDFAGEEVRVQKTINADSIKENKVNTTRGPAVHTSGTRALPPGLKRPAGGASGLGSILNQIGKKKKISVLEKSQLDWKSFKQDEGIDEELQTFNKGKDGYLERQDFLQRTDVRQFEIEKNLRQSRRNP